MIAPQLWTEIRHGRYDAVIIHGHNLAAHHIALAACLSSGTPVFTRGETHLKLTRPGWRSALRKPLLKAHYRGFDGFLAIGSANAAYYRDMGIPDEHIFLVPYTVDNKRFISTGLAERENPEDTRSQLGLVADVPAILYASKFDRRKRPDDVLAAFARLQAEGIKAQLVMVGTGLLEEELKGRVAAEGIRNVVFPGFVNQDKLPSVYAACDVFVLPSSNEPWGLVVNEAMCVALPIVLSDEIGCAEDLVEDGVNGATFTAGDVAGLAAALRPILTDSKRRVAYGAASLARIQEWSYRECGKGIRAGIEAARARRSLGASEAAQRAK
jgi:glycosyltransferase involved in cell wall biosynthesis